MRRRILISVNSYTIDNALTFEAMQDNFSVQLSVNDCEYCIDYDGNWKHLPADTSTETINKGQTLSFKAELVPNTTEGIGTFSATQEFKLKGNCATMLYGLNASVVSKLKPYSFYKLFMDSYVVSISESFLPYLSLSENCYEEMFKNCSRLIDTPLLPAKSLRASCYRGMFENCSLIKTCPEILASDIYPYACSYMFSGCSSLEKIQSDFIFSNINSNGCDHMFANCQNIVGPIHLEFGSIGSNGCGDMFTNCSNFKGVDSSSKIEGDLRDYACSGMFKGCTSLETAPKLMSAQLNSSCYAFMFEECSVLDRITMLASHEPDYTYSHFKNWVNGVASVGTITLNADRDFDITTGVSGIPEGWTVETVTV